LVDEELADDVFVPADRHTLQRLADSRQLLAEERFGEAVRYLGDILDAPEDFFFQPEKNSAVHRSLITEARRLVGQMPRAGREMYELDYGARARRMLDEALAAGNVAALAEVSRRFFHTRSGYQATFLLGLYYFDHGRPSFGAATLQRLREAGPYAEEMEPGLSLMMAACWIQAGAPEKAREVLVALRARQPALRVVIAGREVPLFSNDADAVDWLVRATGLQAGAGGAESDGWLMFRGDPARIAAGNGGVPLLNLRWRVAISDDPLLEAALEQYEKQWHEHGASTIPALHPLAVGDVLLMRTARNLLAVDYSTGKRLWEVPAEGNLEINPGVQAAELQMRQSMMLGGIEQRIWNDLTYGTLSSDGQRVFAVEEDQEETAAAGGGMVRLGPALIVGRARAMGGLPDEQAWAGNRLAAYDIRTGKLRWHLGGPDSPRPPREGGLREAGTFFLGPPLPLLGQLYALGEIKGEIRLLVLDAATGNRAWSQQLAMAEQGVLQDSSRRWAGASPSYADGVLVCPTTTGAIVAIDLSTRSLLWGYRYGTSPAANHVNMGMPMVYSGPGPSRWIDGSVSIVDGRVLVTPAESEWLYCLSLSDGALLWKCPRKNDLYVACADRDKVVLVGRRSVRARRMADGTPAWRRPVELPETSVPSGRGFRTGDRYFLPLTSAEIVGIDLQRGRIVQVAKSRKGDVPGNIICHRGKVISQALQSVDAYCQLDAVQAEAGRRLAANPNDAEALSMRGEVLLDEGKRAEAVASFRRAFELVADPRTRVLLRDTLLDGLRSDFAAYRPQSDEAERLADAPPQRAAFLRLMADGLRQAGEWAPAWESYQKLVDLEPDALPLDPVDSALSVRRDHWFQGRLALLREAAGAEAAAKIDATIAERLKAVETNGSIDALQRFVDYFGNQPAAAPARTELVRRLRSAGRPLEAELTADRGPRTSPPPAIERSGERAAKPDEPAWPTGKVEVETITSHTPPVNPYGRFIIPKRGSSGPFFPDLSLHFDDMHHTLVGRDGYGRALWEVSTNVEGQGMSIAYGATRNLIQARIHGHLVLVVLGWKILAVDTLGAGGDGTPRVLWTQDLMNSGIEMPGMHVVPLPLANLPWPLQQQFAQSYDKTSLLGPVGSRCVVFQRLRHLAAVDPRNGQTLWVRQELPAGSDLFGDEEYLFVLSPNREEAMLLRTSDGELLGTRKIPRLSGRQMLPSGEMRNGYLHLEESCLAALGRRLLLWWPDGDGRVLTLVDPLEGRDLWPERRFSATARAAVAGEEAVGVLEPDGRFVLFGLPDGRIIAEVKLDEEPNLLDITLLAGRGQYFLIVRRSTDAPASIQALPGCAIKPIYDGRLYALDERGKLQWPKPVVLRNQYLWADQPARLPVLCFAALQFNRVFNGQDFQKMSLLCIDKRQGRAVCKQDVPIYAGLLDVTGDAEKKTVDLVMHHPPAVYRPALARPGRRRPVGRALGRRRHGERAVEVDPADARSPARREQQGSRRAEKTDPRPQGPAAESRSAESGRDGPRQAAGGGRPVRRLIPGRPRAWQT
jgi:outer membrane protein assembly factor BamB/tetratricopeptide (TPR) repeat protein